MLLDRRGRGEEARAHFPRLLDEHPEDPAYAYNLALSLDREGRVAEAAPLYERCLALKPDLPEAAACLAWLLATAEDAELRDPGRAAEVLLRALELDRGMSPTLVQVAVDVGARTGRTTRLAELCGRLAFEGEVDARAVRLGLIP